MMSSISSSMIVLSPRAPSFLSATPGYGLEGIVGEMGYPFHIEQFLELLDEGVRGLVRTATRSPR